MKTKVLLQKIIFRVGLLFCICFTFFSYGKNDSLRNANWSNKELFEPRLFIENKGQFVSNTREIFFQTSLNGIKINFYKDGLEYVFEKLDKKYFENELEAEERERNDYSKGIKSQDIDIKKYTKIEKVKIKFMGIDTSKIQIIAFDKSIQYFTYGPDNSMASNYKAFGYKTIMYKNIYEGIDLVFDFHPIRGLKYYFKVMPNYNPGKIKIKWESPKDIQLLNNCLFAKTSYGNICDSLPVSFYEDQPDNKLQTRFVLIKKNTISFMLDDYDQNKTLIIDPWLINPSFSNPNKAFDVSRDAAGNIYAYGSENPFKVIKISPTGSPLWTYNSPFFFTKWIGDIATDFAGFSYISTGDASGQIVKISPGGTLIFNNGSTASTLVPSIFECFRLVFNNSQSQFVTASGAGLPRIANVNSGSGLLSGLSANLAANTSEVRGLTFDSQGNIFALTFKDANFQTSNVIKLNQSFGVLWNVVNTHPAANVNYYSPAYTGFTTTTFVNPNWVTINVPAGQNCIAASNCYVYSYDGQVLQKRLSSNGSLISSINVAGGVTGQNSGIIIDNCENIYVGTSTGVAKYNYLLNLISNVNLNGAVYDLVITNNEIVASGNGFVTSITNLLSINCPIPSGITSFTNTTNCGPCNGLASFSVNNLIPPLNYFWSNGNQTLNTTSTVNTITGLCPGVYQVTVTSCNNYTYTTSYTLTGSASNLTVNATVQNANCTSPTGSVIINSVTNGVPNYTLVQGTNTLAAGFNTPYTLTNVSVGTHTYVLTSANGCSTTFTVTVLGAANSLTLSPTVTHAICGTGTVS
ncbi:MAG: hypothetical protein ACK50A_17840, partial [Sphingobacteriaceae bacterium]